LVRRHAPLLLAATLLLAGTAATSKPKESSITFLSPAEGGGVITSDETLPYGSVASIFYDAERLPDCRGTLDGVQPAWSISGYYQFNGGPVQGFWVAGASGDPFPPAPSLLLSERGELTVWFDNSNRWGCYAWDPASDVYRFTVR
jgi:hypothetical protein